MTYAFPHNTVVVDKDGGVKENYRGMELRDYFAAKAMQGLFAANAEHTHNDEDIFDVVADAAYKTADAMMVAREK